MFDFIYAALPWVVMGIAVACITAYWGTEKRKNEK